MAADRLAIYNAALAHLGSRELLSLEENREPRRLLDRQWAAAVLYTLEQAPWSFACRSVLLAPDPGNTPSFGYRSAFAKPVDWLKTVRLATDEIFAAPVNRYTDEGGFWLTDGSQLFVRYVSQDRAYGLDPSLWSPSFADYLALHLAQKTCQRLTGSDAMLGDLVKLETAARKRAKANDALSTAPIRPPAGSWVRAVHGVGSSREDGWTSGFGLL